jgi:hypothetical protein
MGALDVYLDILQMDQYLAGSVYIQQHTQLINVTESQDSNCTLIGWFVAVENSSTNNRTDYYQYECTEVYPVWGFITLFFFFVPGISSFLLGSSYSRYLISMKRYAWLENKFCLNLSLLLMSIATTFTFPFQFLTVKIIGLINSGSEWQKLGSKIGIAEALMDASLQYVLTLFIVFINADQEASFIQKLGLIPTMFFLAIARIDAWLMDEGGNHMNWQRKVVKSLPLLPLAMTNSAFKLGSMSFITAILGYNSIFFYGPIFVTIVVIASLFAQGCLPAEQFHLVQGSFVHAIGIGKISKLAVLKGLATKMKTVKQTEEQQTRNIMFQNIFWLVINSMMIGSLIILVNVYPQAKIPVFAPFFLSDTYVIGELAMAPYINYFGPTILGLGLISMVLTIIKCYEERMDDKEKIEIEAITEDEMTPSPFVQTLMMMLDNLAYD